MARMNHSEIDRFAHELGSFVRSGMPLPEALRELASQLPEGRLRTLSEQSAKAIDRGVPLSQALEQSPNTVPPEFIALIRCGEITGDMGSVLDFAMRQSRRVAKFRAALFTSMVYPAILVLAIIGAMAFVANFLTPRFEEVFQQLGAELPSLTQLSMQLSSIFGGLSGALIVGVILLLFALPVFLHDLRDVILEKFSLLPGFSALTATGDTSVYTRFLAEMLPRGVPLPTALKAASLAVTMRQTRIALEQMSQAAERGQAAHPHLAPHTPSTAAFLFQQGETNGRLAEACDAIGAYCEERFDRIDKQAIAFVEPFLIVAVSLMIGLYIMSLYLPLFSIPKLIR